MVISIESKSQSYCSSIAAQAVDDDIYKVTVNGASTNSLYQGCVVAPGPGSILNRYSNFMTLGSLTSVNLGATVSFSIEVNDCDGAPYFPFATAVWIDYNHNGSFNDVGEKVFVEASTLVGPRTVTGTFVVPLTVLCGQTGMRIIEAESNSGAGLTSCLQYQYGETEDYLITIGETPVVTSVSACDSYIWSVSGNSYSTSGTYTNTSLNANGCLHSETLILTINSSTVNATNVTACDQYTWGLNGNTYTSSGSYTLTATACHTETLNLTINQNTSSNEIQTACGAYLWAANGATYSASGVYTHTSMNTANCVHTQTLNMTITGSGISCSNTNTLSINTGMDLSNSTPFSANGITDPAWTATTIGGSVFNPAVTYAHGSWASSTISYALGYSSSSAGQRTFRRTFKTCADDTLTFNLSLAYDDWLNGILIDGVLITSPSTITIVSQQNNSTNYSSFHSFNFTRIITAGTHTIDINVVNIGNTRSGLNVAGVITSNSNSLVANSSPANCCCVPMPPPCNASFNVNTTYCKSGSIAVNAATVANGIFNKWEVFEANGNCTALTSALLEYTSNTLNLSLSMPVFLEGHCYQLKHSVLWGTNVLCTSSLCFCVAAPTYIYDTICAQGSYYWGLNGTTYNTSGIYTYTTTTPNACEIHVLNVTITNLAALHFDGVNDYVMVPHNTSLPIDTSNFTIECWTKFDNANPSNDKTIWSKYDWVLNKGLSLYIFNNQYIGLDYNGISVGRDMNFNIYDNLWHHIALRRTGNLIYFYVDGAQIGTVLNVSYLNNYIGLVDFSCASPLYIGSAYHNNFNTPIYPLLGAIDEMRVWGYARSVAQLQNASTCDIKAQYKLKAYYRFNEGIPLQNNTPITTIMDVSGLNHPGTIYNMALVSSSSNYVGGNVGCCQYNHPANHYFETACASYTWPITGLTYNATGLYTSTTTADTLHLTVNNQTNYIYSQTANGYYVWAANGLTYTTSGTYNAILTNTMGCDSSIAMNLSIIPTLSLTIDSVQAVTCNAESNGSFHINIDGGSGNYSYQLEGSMNCCLVSNCGVNPAYTCNSSCHCSNSSVPDNGKYNLLKADHYKITITDNVYNISVIDSVEISQPNPIQISSTTNTYTTASTNNAISLYVIGGLAPYTYQWLQADANNNFVVMSGNNLSAITNQSCGYYQAQITDANSCVKNSSFSIGFGFGGCPAACCLPGTIPAQLHKESFENYSMVNPNDTINSDLVKSPNALIGSYSFATYSTDRYTLDTVYQRLAYGGLGKYLLVEGSNNINKVIWKDSFAVIAGNQYPFWAGINIGIDKGLWSDTLFSFRIDGVAYPIDPNDFKIPDLLGWQYRGTCFTPTQSKKYEFALVQNNTGYIYGVDEISVDVCTPILPPVISAGVKPDVIDVCPNVFPPILLDIIHADNPPYDVFWLVDSFHGIYRPTLSAGIYPVVITDALNNVSYDTVKIITRPSMNFPATILGTSSMTSADGAIDLTGSSYNVVNNYYWSTGANTQDISGLSIGTYSVTVLDAFGCQSTNTFNVNLQTLVAGTTAVNYVSPCNGGNVNLSLSGNTTSGVNYQWQTSIDSVVWNNVSGATSNMFVTSCPATELYYRCALSNTTATVQSNASLVHPCSPVSISFDSVSSVSCYGGNNGSITISAIGGNAKKKWHGLLCNGGYGICGMSPVYSYNWSNGDTSNQITDLTAGIYTLVVTDSLGCNTTATYTITQPSEFIARDSIIPVTTLNGNNGAIYPCLMGGVPPYNYLWSTSSTNSFLSNLTQGEYTLQASDANGCLPLLDPPPNVSGVYPSNGECPATNILTFIVPEVFVSGLFQPPGSNFIKNSSFEITSINVTSFPQIFSFQNGNIHHTNLNYVNNAQSGIAFWNFTGANELKSSGFNSFINYFNKQGTDNINPNDGTKFLRLYGREHGIHQTFSFLSSTTSRYIKVSLADAPFAGIMHIDVINGVVKKYHAKASFKVWLKFSGSAPNQYAYFYRTTNDTLPNDPFFLNWKTDYCIADVPTGYNSVQLGIGVMDCYDGLAIDNVKASMGQYIRVSITNTATSGGWSFSLSSSIDPIGGLLLKPPYSYLWSNGAATANTTMTTTGTYSLAVTDANNKTVYYVGKIDPISTTAGTGTAGYSGDHGLAKFAKLNSPNCVAYDKTKKRYYIDEVGNQRIRKVDQQGIITTIAGTGIAGYSGDGGLAKNAQINNPIWVDVDNVGNVYFTDQANKRVRKIDTMGIITTIAGNGMAGSSGDGGPATAAQLNNPSGVAISASGNLYITEGNRIRKVNTSGIISTIAGNGIAGFSGDGDSAINAKVNYPYGICVDQYENIIFSDVNNYRVRKIDSFGMISTLAGTGIAGTLGNDTLATAAQLNTPVGVATDDYGNVFVSELYSHRIRKIDQNGIISIYAGNGTYGYSGDGGPSPLAQLFYPTAMSFDSSGNMFVCDGGNHAIRKIGTIDSPSSTKLNVSLFIQGYYLGNGMMTSVLLNQGVSNDPQACDSITVELHNTMAPYAMVASTKTLLYTNGNAVASFPLLSGSYYVVIKGRNALETWSATPVLMNDIWIPVEWKTIASKVYGSNLIQMDPGTYAIFSGDVNQDENNDLLDIGAIETDISNFIFGYYPTDLNGDGNVDLLDGSIIEPNVNNFIFSSHP